MRFFIDEHGRVREADVAAIACELGISGPHFDVADWVVKALGWVDLTLGEVPQRLRWRPSQLRAATAFTARRLVIDADALKRITLIRWLDGWHTTESDGVVAAWMLGEAIRPDRTLRPTWQITRRTVADLYRDRNLALIEDLSRVAGRAIDGTSAAEIVETTASGVLGMVECKGPGQPFHYVRVGCRIRLFDRPEAFVGRDLRESSDPAFSAVCVASYEAAMASDGPVIEDIQGPLQYADGRTRDIAYRRVLMRVAGSAKGPAIIMKTSEYLRPSAPILP